MADCCPADAAAVFAGCAAQVPFSAEQGGGKAKADGCVAQVPFPPERTTGSHAAGGGQPGHGMPGGSGVGVIAVTDVACVNAPSAGIRRESPARCRTLPGRAEAARRGRACPARFPRRFLRRPQGAVRKRRAAVFVRSGAIRARGCTAACCFRTHAAQGTLSGTASGFWKTGRLRAAASGLAGHGTGKRTGPGSRRAAAPQERTLLSACRQWATSASRKAGRARRGATCLVGVRVPGQALRRPASAAGVRPAGRPLHPECRRDGSGDRRLRQKQEAARRHARARQAACRRACRPHGRPGRRESGCR